MKKEDVLGYFDVTGKVALITGAAGAFGTTASRALAAMGVKVMGVDLAAEQLEKLVKQIHEDGGQAASSVCDITNHDDVKRVVQETVDTFNGIDILITAAGVNWNGFIHEQSYEEWQKVMDINTKGTYLFCKEVGKVMMNQGRGGKVIFLGSARGQLGLSRYTGYCASKAAVHLLAKTLACEWGPHKINVNCIAPSVFRSPITRHVFEDPELNKIVLGRIPIGRLAEPDDFIGTVLYLSSKASDWMTGSIVNVDGGYLAG